MILSRRLPSGLVIVLVLLIGAFGLRLWDLNGPSIWHDEAWSIRAIRDPIHTPDDNTPPVYYGLMHLLWRGAGESPFALRYGSVLLDLITVALGAQIARRWAGWEAGILAAVLLGASPLLWAYAREIRAYVAVPLLALVLLALLDRLLEPRTSFPWRVWLTVLVAEVILLYTHNLSVPVIAWLNLVVGGLWAWQRRWRWLGIWLAGQAAALIVYLPWLLGQSPSGTPLNTPPRLSFALVWDIWQAYFAPVPAQIGHETALLVGSAIFGLAALASLVAILTRNRSRRTLLIVSQAVLLPALATIELVGARIDFHPRYYVAGVPAALLVVALGVGNLPEAFELRRLAVPAAIALAAGVGAASLVGLLDDPAYQHDDFRGLANFYAALPAEALIVVPYGWEPTLDVYYAEKAGIQAEMLGIDLHSDAQTAISTINEALERRSGPVQIQLLTWYQLPADVRGMYPCLLESAGRLSGSAFAGQGLLSMGYTVERPLDLVDMPGATGDYGAVSLVGAASSGQGAVCLRTTWTLQQQKGENWRVAGRMLTTDPAGWVIAHSDSDIRADDQTAASEWNTGEQGEAYSLLRCPAGSPPGEYTFQITVYGASEPNGLDRLIGGIPSGKVTDLATVRLEGTTDRTQTTLPGQPVPLSNGIELAGHDAHDEELMSGQELRITLHWRVPGGDLWSGADLALWGEDWELVQPVEAYPGYSLDWHAFRIPAGASGEAVLTLESDSVEPVRLARYSIQKTDRLFALPPFDIPVQAEFKGVAVLEGASLSALIVSPDEVLDLTLVWRAAATPGTSYRIFTHLLDPDRRVIAQHDGYPVDGSRPTTGWVADEYLVDRHGLTFQITDYRGPAQLEVGFYNPETNYRVLLSNGADHMILPVEIMVQ